MNYNQDIYSVFDIMAYHVLACDKLVSLSLTIRNNETIPPEIGDIIAYSGERWVVYACDFRYCYIDNEGV